MIKRSASRFATQLHFLRSNRTFCWFRESIRSFSEPKFWKKVIISLLRPEEIAPLQFASTIRFTLWNLGFVEIFTCYTYLHFFARIPLFNGYYFHKGILYKKYVKEKYTLWCYYVFMWWYKKKTCVYVL